MMHGPIRQRKATYKRDFDIQRSWIPNNNDITESMLSYSRRMSEVSKSRAILHKDSDIELPLLIKATHLPHPGDRTNRTQDRYKVSGNIQGGYRARSLPNMKLEPLLGSNAKYKLNTATLMDLKSVKGVKLKFLKSKFLDPLPSHNESSMQSNDVEIREEVKEEYVSPAASPNQTHTNEEVEDKSITRVVVHTAGSQTLENTAAPDTQSTDIIKPHNAINKLPKIPNKSTVRSLGKPRRNKRMKFKKSQLESIEEDDSEVLARLSRSSSYNKLPLLKTYNPGATVDIDTDFHDFQMSLEERRKDVALLRQLSNSNISSRMSSQLTMQILAKKKLRKLPQISRDIVD